MIEESIESFITQFRAYAAPVEVLSRTEGSPMLECVVGQHVLHLLERTNPYEAQPGQRQIIINPTAASVEASDDTRKQLNPTALSELSAVGLVLERQEEALIIDAGVTLVVNMFDPIPESFIAGDWVSFQSLAPIHGFYVPPTKRSVYQRREPDTDSI